MAESHNVALVKLLANSIWPRHGAYVASASTRDVESLRTTPERRDIHEELMSLSRGLAILKVKIYDTDGLTVYSSDVRQIGEDKKGNQGFSSAKRGIPASKLGFRAMFSAYSGELFERDVVETYVPVGGADGGPSGVFEIYTDVTPTMQEIERTTIFLLITLILIFSVLYGLLYLIVRHANRIMAGQYQRLQHQQEQLSAKNAELDREIEERKKTEEALVQARKMEALGTMAGGIAHNLNNLLLPILSLGKLTYEQLPKSSHHRERLDRIVGAGQSARDVVAGMLTFARSEPPERVDADVYEIVRRAMDLISVSVPSAIRTNVDLDPDTGIVSVDSTQLQTVLINLASNAIDAMGRGPGEFTVALGPVHIEGGEAGREAGGEADGEAGGEAGDQPGLAPGSYAKLVVSDTGIGMDAKTITRAFDPFFTTKEVGRGTGLGLASAHGIVSGHGGVIHVTSEPGVGTTATVFLPIIGADADRYSPPPAPETGGPSRPDQNTASN